MELAAIPHSMDPGSLESTVGSAQLSIGSGTEQVMQGFVELQDNQIVQAQDGAHGDPGAHVTGHVE